MLLELRTNATVGHMWHHGIPQPFPAPVQHGGQIPGILRRRDLQHLPRQFGVVEVEGLLDQQIVLDGVIVPARIGKGRACGIEELAVGIGLPCKHRKRLHLLPLSMSARRWRFTVSHSMASAGFTARILIAS